MPKVNIDKVMDDCVSIKNQIDGLNLLLIQRKQTLAKYFESSGKKQLSNDDCVISVAEKAKIEYDVDALQEKLPQDISSQIIEKHYEISDWPRFVKFMKSKGISGSELRPFVSIQKQVDEKAISRLYDEHKLTLTDMDGCYTAKVTKSVVLRLKNARQEINLT